MEQNLKDILINTFKPFDEGEELDQRFYEFIDNKTLEKFLEAEKS